MTSSPLMMILLAAVSFSSEALARNEKQEIEAIIRGDVVQSPKALSQEAEAPLEDEAESENGDMAIPLTQGFFGDMGDGEKKTEDEVASSENSKIFYVKEREPHQNLNGHPVLDPTVVEKVSTQMEEREKKKKATWWDQFMQFLGLGS